MSYIKQPTPKTNVMTFFPGLHTLPFVCTLWANPTNRFLFWVLFCEEHFSVSVIFIWKNNIVTHPPTLLKGAKHWSSLKCAIIMHPWQWRMEWRTRIISLCFMCPGLLRRKSAIYITIVTVHFATDLNFRGSNDSHGLHNYTLFFEAFTGTTMVIKHHTCRITMAMMGDAVE